MNPFRKKVFLNPLHKKENENDRRSFIRKSIAAMFGATILTQATDLFSLESKTGYVYVKENGEVINHYSPSSATPFLGQIVVYGFQFAPIGWFKCEGQLLNVADYTALFALLGIQYGGNGSTTFALPDFRGRVPIHTGQGAGLSNYAQGQAGGSADVTLLNNQIPAHSHLIRVTSDAGTTPNPSGNYIAQNIEGISAYAASTDSLMNAGSIGTTGSSLPHSNLQPILAMNICIARQGVFPSR